jgi:hypothetical protein
MAVKIIANYSKKLGLPGYSSHQFSVSVETEVQNIEQIAEENERLYSVLQTSVDKQIQTTGFVPPHEYGMNGANGNGNGQRQRQPQQRQQEAGISEKQLDLINRIVNENNLNKTEVENICVEMFGGGVRSLNRMQASNFIDELFERYPRKNSNGNGNGRANYQRQQQPAAR